MELHTEQLVLISTPPEVLQRRLERADFAAPVNINGTATQVHFPTEWPGDALVLFPMWLEQTLHDPQALAWGGTIIERTSATAIGQIGFKGLPDANGMIELGYGVVPEVEGRGYATEMARALVEWAWQQPQVRTITAECRVDNMGSLRVLEKSGFRQTGQRTDAEDGPLLLWEYQ